MDRVDIEIEGAGNRNIAANFEWGAFVQCLMAAAYQHGLPCKSDDDFAAVASHLDGTSPEGKWTARLESAKRLEHHFYHGSLAPQDLEEIHQQTRKATLELVAATGPTTNISPRQ